MLNRIAKNTVFGDHHQGDDRHEYQRRHAGDAQAEPLRGRQRLQLFITTALPLAQPRLDHSLSVISPPTSVRTITEVAIKYQLSITLTCKEASMDFAALGADPGEQHVGG